MDIFKKGLATENLAHRNPRVYAMLLANLAETQFKTGKTVGVEESLLTSLRIRDSINHGAGVVSNRIVLSEFYLYRRDTLKALEFSLEAKNLAERIYNFKGLLSSLMLLSEIDRTNSEIYFKEYIQTRDSLQKVDRRLQNKFARIQFETDRYIEETNRLNEQRAWIISVSLVAGLTLLLLFLLKVQRTRNKELLFEKAQQASNEKIYKLMIKQQAKFEEGKRLERERISAELHDGVLGRLFGMRMGFGFLELQGTPKIMERFQSLQKELQKAEGEIRKISHDLVREIGNETVHFTEIVEQLLEEKRAASKIDFRFLQEGKIDWKAIDDAIHIHFYRIIQEATQNVIRHSEADHVLIKITTSKEKLTLIIKDNGQGFDVNKRKKGIGIRNMEKRAANLEGEFHIESSKICTKLTFIVPIKFYNNGKKIL